MRTRKFKLANLETEALETTMPAFTGKRPAGMPKTAWKSLAKLMSFDAKRVSA